MNNHWIYMTDIIYYQSLATRSRIRTLMTSTWVQGTPKPSPHLPFMTKWIYRVLYLLAI